ncbi:hypothetical protein AFLA_000064, partial [Aspergillus flavus NRRL3357]
HIPILSYPLVLVHRFPAISTLLSTDLLPCGIIIRFIIVGLHSDCALLDLTLKGGHARHESSTNGSIG